MVITCWNCGQRLEDIHQLSEVRQIGISLFGHCPGCGKDVPCRELIKIHRVIDLRGKRNERTRTHRISKMHDPDISDHKTGIQGRQAEKQTSISSRGEKMDRAKHVGIDSVDGPPNIRERLSCLVVRNQTQDQKERNVTK